MVAADVAGFPGAGDRDPQAISQDIIANAMAGVESLLKMPPDELRGVIAKRAELLDTELKEREGRAHKAIDEALAAQRGLGSQASAGQTHPPEGQYWELCRRCNVYGASSSFRCSKASKAIHMKKRPSTGALFLFESETVRSLRPFLRRDVLEVFDNLVDFHDISIFMVHIEQADFVDDFGPVKNTLFDDRNM